MTIHLYEDAIADARHIRGIAEDNAKRAVIAAVEPQIRDLIERHLMESTPGADLGDDSDDDDVVVSDVAPPAVSEDPAGAGAITPPGPDGKVTLDLDALSACVTDAVQPSVPASPDDEFVLNAESIAALEPIVAGGRFTENEIELQTYRLGEEIAQFSRAGRAIRASRGYAAKISEMISRVKNTYECVQESVNDSAKRRSLGRKLEAFNRALGRLTESQMSIRRGSRINEGEVTLKLTGMPDELDLDGVGVDLIKDEGDGEDDAGDGAGGDLDLSGGDDDGSGGSDSLDLSGGDEGEEKMGEGRRLSDNTVVEIDEGMLRREITRMRSLREEAVPSTKGHAPRGSEVDDFGGGTDEGDAWLDSDVPKGATNLKVVGEGEDDEVLEIDMGGDGGSVDECDDMPTTEMQNRRKRDERGADAAESHATMGESRTRLFRERRMQSRITARMNELKALGRRARAAGDTRKLAEAAAAFRLADKQLRVSQRRANRLREGLAESARASRMGARSNSGPRRPTETRGVSPDLRSRVSQLNLRNAKLTATTRLLQNESLTPQQRADIVERLEAAKNPREVKLVYESLVSTLGKRSRSLAEGQDRGVLGSASRATRSAGSTLNESNEAARWAQLAGIR